MKNQHSQSRSFNLFGYGVVLLLLFSWLTAGTAAAAGPLPLPDLLVYGTVTNATGDRLEGGMIRALLNGQTIASAEIHAISGADYNYLLVVPMGMIAPGSTDRDSSLALVGDVLSFTVDGHPAYYQDPVSSLTVDQLRIPSAAAGSSVVLDLALSDAMRYLLGDVNANGARNAADAMLTLKYDIGQIIGVTNFPPGPNTVYLPLCDIVENGRCDSSDALRILQCDAGLNTVTCPAQTIAAVPNGGNSADAPTQIAETPVQAASGDAIGLQVTTSEDTDTSTVAVSVRLTDGGDRFGAASFELRYDPALLTPTACTADPDAAFDMVVCNVDYAPGLVRFNAIATSGADDSASVIALRFQRADDATAATPSFTLTADSVTDVDGAALDWRDESADTPAAETLQKIFLPVIVGPGAAPAEQTPQETPQETPTSIFLPSIVGPNPTPAEQSTQDAPYRLFLPAVVSDAETSLTSETPDKADPPAAEPSPTATPEPTPIDAGLPVEKPTVEPIAPSNELPPVEEPEPAPQDNALRWGAAPVAILPSTRARRGRQIG